MSDSSPRRSFLMKGFAALAGATFFSGLLRGTARSQSKTGPQTFTGGDPFIGEITLVPYNFAPLGWAFCNGQLLSVEFDASRLASGMYVYRIQAGQFVKSRTMVLLK